MKLHTEEAVFLQGLWNLNTEIQFSMSLIRNRLCMTVMQMRNKIGMNLTLMRNKLLTNVRLMKFLMKIYFQIDWRRLKSSNLSMNLRNLIRNNLQKDLMLMRNNLLQNLKNLKKNIHKFENIIFLAILWQYLFSILKRGYWAHGVKIGIPCTNIAWLGEFGVFLISELETIRG